MGGLPSAIPQDPETVPTGWPGNVAEVKRPHEASATDWIKEHNRSELLPVARLHMGGDVFWAPPVRVMPTYYQATWPSRGWGYVVKADFTLAMLQHLQATQGADIDQRISGKEYLEKYAILTPKKPIILGMKSASATEFGPRAAKNEVFKQKSDEDMQVAFEKACWHACPVVLGDCRSLP